MAITEELREATRLWKEILRASGQAPLQSMAGGGILKTTKLSTQRAVMNPEPIAQIQVRPIFKLWLAMDMASDITGDDVPHTEKGHMFCMSYHPKGVRNYKASQKLGNPNSFKARCH